MIRNNDAIFFTEQDKNNLSVKEYTTEELIENEKSFKNKRNRRRYIFLIFLLMNIIFLALFKQTAFYLYITLVFLIFVIILCEYIDKINLEAIRRKFYIEIIINEKLKPETILEQTLSPGSKATKFFPIRGSDTETGYESVFYVEQDQYNAEIGDKIRISIKSDLKNL